MNKEMKFSDFLKNITVFIFTLDMANIMFAQCFGFSENLHLSTWPKLETRLHVSKGSC